MKAFLTFLTLFLIALIGYSAITILNHGWNLFPVFFGDIVAMNWPGQFNFDFLGFLMLSAIWTMWRNSFSLQGIILGVCAFFGGMLFLSIYLLYLCNKEPNIQRVLVGGRTEHDAAIKSVP